MKAISKVLWGEGLFLRPQVFQHQDRYHESRLNEISKALHPYVWGIQKLEVDQAALALGTLLIQQISVIFPDGEIYTAPVTGELPAAIELNGLPSDVSEVTVYLAQPQLSTNRSNMAQQCDNGDLRRYRQEKKSVQDFFTEAAEGQIDLLTPMVRLLTEHQQREAFCTLPLIRLRRVGEGAFAVVTEFMPPTLSLDGAPTLKADLRNLVESLQAKVESLHRTLREPSKDVVEFRGGDTASFWLLHTANTSCASLMHLLSNPQFHPERLYQELLRLAGALMTFSKTHRLSDLPAYDHLTPGPAFNTLFAIIGSLVNTVISARYFNIPLDMVKTGYHQGRIDAQRIDKDASLYLGVSAQIAGTELAKNVPHTFKVGAPDLVDRLVSSSMPGVVLTYTPQVPSAIPIRPGMLYFALEPHGDVYENMRKSQTVMVFVPTGLAELKLELIALTS